MGMLHSLMMLTCLRVPVASHWLPSLKVGLSLSLYKYVYIYPHLCNFWWIAFTSRWSWNRALLFQAVSSRLHSGSWEASRTRRTRSRRSRRRRKRYGAQSTRWCPRFSFFDRIDLGHFRAVRLLSVSRVDFFRPDPVEGAKCVFRWKARQFLRPQSREKGRRQADSQDFSLGPSNDVRVTSEDMGGRLSFSSSLYELQCIMYSLARLSSLHAIRTREHRTLERHGTGLFRAEWYGNTVSWAVDRFPSFGWSSNPLDLSAKQSGKTLAWPRCILPCFSWQARVSIHPWA